jgi:hypothetical protein
MRTPDLQLGDSWMADHLPPLVIADAISRFGVHIHGLECAQIGNKLSDLHVFVEDRKAFEWVKRDTAEP